MVAGAVRSGPDSAAVTFAVTAPVYGAAMADRTSACARTLRLIPGGRRDGDGRETVDLVRHDTGAVENIVWTLPRLLAAIGRRRRPAHPAWTYSVGRGRRRLAILTDGPARFIGQHPCWADTGRPDGAMIFPGMSFTDVRRVLERFYAGASPERCFDGLPGELCPEALATPARHAR